MRIAVDARAFEAKPTGVGRYLEGLLTAWVQDFGDEIVLLSPRPIRIPQVLTGRGRVWSAPPGASLPGTVWLQTVAPILAERHAADLFFAPLGILPLGLRIPAVVTVHDLTPLLFPSWHDARNRLGFVPFIAASVRKARRIAAVSQATRSDLLAFFPEAAETCAVVPNGISPVRTPEAVVGSRERPYILYLGTLEPRKNVPRLVEACESIWDRRPDFPDLVVAGGDGWGLPDLASQLAASRHAARIARLGYVPHEETAALIAHARVLAYPSLYEGFGLPPLEAMALGTVVVGSSSSSLPEVLGDAALLPDPTSVAAIAAALEKAAFDETWRAAARRLGFQRAGRFTWSRAAHEMRALFVEALS